MNRARALAALAQAARKGPSVHVGPPGPGWLARAAMGLLTALVAVAEWHALTKLPRNSR